MDKGATILIVDDDYLARWSTRERLSEHKNFTIDEAESAEEAVAKVESGTYDLILLDIGLPGMSGAEALEKLLRPSLRVIMLTAEDSEGVTLDCLDQGAFDYLCKPIDLDAIEAAVLRAVGSTKGDDSPAAGDDPSYLKRFVGISDACQEIRQLVKRIAASRASTILVQGESGTGKEVIAKAIHEGSSVSGTFMTVNCTAVPSGLLESELFGHEKGAFTSAEAQKRGLFELARGGTLLLDEIGDLDPSLQVKLLRVIEERTFRRVGGTVDIAVGLRIIATTNVDLSAAVDSGGFRVDLFHRLNVIPVTVPPLRERRDDIPVLVEHFVRLLNHELAASVESISAGAMGLLCRYAWPGNARQLKNVLERIMVVETTTSTILVDHLPPEVRFADPVGREAAAVGDRAQAPIPQLPEEGISLESVERELIRQALERTGGNITRAGALVGLHRDTLRYRARKYGLTDA